MHHHLAQGMQKDNDAMITIRLGPALLAGWCVFALIAGPLTWRMWFAPRAMETVSAAEQ